MSFSPDDGSASAASDPIDKSERPLTGSLTEGLGTSVPSHNSEGSSLEAASATTTSEGEGGRSATADGGGELDDYSSAASSGTNLEGEQTEQAASVNSSASATASDLSPRDESVLMRTGAQALLPDQILASASFAASGVVNAQDTEQVYQFSVAQSGVFNAVLSGLTGDADVQLIQDTNRNGEIDNGEILALQWERGSDNESIRRFIGEGDYLVRVVSHQEADTSFQLDTSFTAAAQDSNAVSFNLNLRGLDGLNDQALASIQRAANFWENAITHSSFEGAHTINVNVLGTTNTENNFLAFAGPQSFRRDSNDRYLAARGLTVINLAHIDDYNRHPDFLEAVLRHEFGHVLGLGTNWTPERGPLVGNDFVDFDNNTYRADTYAGLAYGELLGQSEGVAIPLDSVSSHWSEAALDRELLTPRAESIETPLPLSQVTLGSLRDLGFNVNFGAAEVDTLSALVPSASSLA